MLDKFSDIDDKVKCGSELGKIAGMIAGVFTTVGGGYEIGTVINNHIGIEGYFGRGAIDFITMSIVATPVILGSAIVGFVGGAALGAVSHPFIELGYKGYNYFRGD